RQGANLILFLYVARRVFLGELQIGDYSLYTGALTSIANCINDMVNTTASVYEGTLFINNMIDFMEEKQSIVPLTSNPLHVRRHIAHRFDLIDVSFHYPGSDRMVIDHLNLTIEAGETVVLVGLNGAGKTTLIKLLTRLYDPTGGTILLYGEDLRAYDVSELYETFGIIFQDFGEYAVSVGENISFGQIDKPYSEEAVRKAAEQSDADSFIRRLPKEYETPLMRYFSTDGVELSVGQWQKLAVARAFYADSDIMILDEPTASLDPIAEQAIFAQFDELRKDKTTLFVSHRLSSATTADRIVFLENGKVAESGTHHELMALGGRYCELFTTQASRYVEEMTLKPNRIPRQAKNPSSEGDDPIPGLL
ncbi:MAG: ABC transporter ATP-binding protein, partial [Clostridia bacterium]|nr:ABC transporter ATP-binding protein [Clostridia bacterium]